MTPTAWTTDQTTDQTPQQTTGVPEVDDVLLRVAGVDDRPVNQHVEVFESAHRALRRVLDAD